MAFGDFTFPQVQQDLGLTLDAADLYSDVPGVPIRQEWGSMIEEGKQLALAIDTDKARSEFMIAPILLELRRRLGQACSLFSGTELNVDPVRGLNGVCDFIISQSPMPFVLTDPLVTIVEAKNDNNFNGLGPCIASMVAADLFNQKAGRPIPVIHGVVSTGSAWKFLRLRDSTVTIDLKEYYISNPGKILGVLESLVRSS
jgi:hypothetical protein